MRDTVPGEVIIDDKTLRSGKRLPLIPSAAVLLHQLDESVYDTTSRESTQSELDTHISIELFIKKSVAETDRVLENAKQIMVEHKNRLEHYYKINDSVQHPKDTTADETMKKQNNVENSVGLGDPILDITQADTFTTTPESLLEMYDKKRRMKTLNNASGDYENQHVPSLTRKKNLSVFQQRQEIMSEGTFNRPIKSMRVSTRRYAARSRTSSPTKTPSSATTRINPSYSTIHRADHIKPRWNNAINALHSGSPTSRVKKQLAAKRSMTTTPREVSSRIIAGEHNGTLHSNSLRRNVLIPKLSSVKNVNVRASTKQKMKIRDR